MFKKSAYIRFITGIIFLSFGLSSVATELVPLSTASHDTVKLPGCEIEFRDQVGGAQVVGRFDPSISPPGVEIKRFLNGLILTFRLSCERPSDQIDDKKNIQTSGLTEIGVKLSNGKWTRAIDGRYYANLKSTKSIKGKNWEGILSYVDGWEGDGQNTGDRTLGFCVAPDYRVCGIAADNSNGGSGNGRRTLTPRGKTIITSIYEGTFIRRE
jgi:hypothetical protein